ncbi:hypothetical protein ON010_g14260 [Phytophthora cinnamomi]|nr:hypothetical protein ON010_g14260 [Phytophthora cinnamomi]
MSGTNSQRAKSAYRSLYAINRSRSAVQSISHATRKFSERFGGPDSNLGRRTRGCHQPFIPKSAPENRPSPWDDVRLRDVVSADIARVDEEGLGIQEIYGAQQRPMVPASRWLITTKLRFTGQVKPICFGTAGVKAGWLLVNPRKAVSGAATTKQKAATTRAPSKRRKKVVTNSTVSAGTEAPADLLEATAEVVPGAPVDVAKTTDQDVTETTVTTDTTEAVVTEVQHTAPDWLLSLESDAEGDEETILLDENEGTEEDGSVENDVEGEQSDNDGADGAEVPLGFDLSDDELDRLGANGWDTLDERRSDQDLHDAAPLYEGPWGPHT